MTAEEENARWWAARALAAARAEAERHARVIAEQVREADETAARNARVMARERERQRKEAGES